MGTVELLGVSHFDLAAEERVKCSLEAIDPSVVTVELCENEAQLLRQHADLIGGCPPDIQEWLAAMPSDIQGVVQRLVRHQGSEFIAAEDFARDRALPFHEIDALWAMDTIRCSMVDSVRTIMRTWGRERFIQSLQGWSQEKSQRSSDTLYAIFADAHRKPDIERDTRWIDESNSRGIFALDRDEMPAARLAQLAQEAKGKIAHVCGAIHTLDDTRQQTLYSKLRGRGIPVHRGIIAKEAELPTGIEDLQKIFRDVLTAMRGGL